MPYPQVYQIDYLKTENDYYNYYELLQLSWRRTIVTKVASYSSTLTPYSHDNSDTSSFFLFTKRQTIKQLI